MKMSSRENFSQHALRVVSNTARCQLIIWSMVAMLRDSTIAVVVRTRPRATSLAMITMRKSTHGFPLVSHIWDAYGAPLSGPSGHRSSAVIIVIVIVIVIVITIAIVTVIVIVIVIVIVGLAAFSDSYYFFTGSSTNLSPSPTTAVTTSSRVTISPLVMAVLSTKTTSKNFITELSMASLTSMSSSGFVVTKASEPEVVVSSLARLVPNTGRSALTFYTNPR